MLRQNKILLLVTFLAACQRSEAATLFNLFGGSSAGNEQLPVIATDSEPQTVSAVADPSVVQNEVSLDHPETPEVDITLPAEADAAAASASASSNTSPAEPAHWNFFDFFSGPSSVPTPNAPPQSNNQNEVDDKAEASEAETKEPVITEVVLQKAQTVKNEETKVPEIEDVAMEMKRAEGESEKVPEASTNASSGGLFSWLWRNSAPATQEPVLKLKIEAEKQLSTFELESFSEPPRPVWSQAFNLEVKESNSIENYDLQSFFVEEAEEPIKKLSSSASFGLEESVPSSSFVPEELLKEEPSKEPSRAVKFDFQRGDSPNSSDPDSLWSNKYVTSSKISEKIPAYQHPKPEKALVHVLPDDAPLSSVDHLFRSLCLDTANIYKIQNVNPRITKRIDELATIYGLRCLWKSEDCRDYARAKGHTHSLPLFRDKIVAELDADRKEYASEQQKKRTSISRDNSPSLVTEGTQGQLQVPRNVRIGSNGRLTPSNMLNVKSPQRSSLRTPTDAKNLRKEDLRAWYRENDAQPLFSSSETIITEAEILNSDVSMEEYDNEHEYTDYEEELADFDAEEGGRIYIPWATGRRADDSQKYKDIVLNGLEQLPVVPALSAVTTPSPKQNDLDTEGSDMDESDGCEIGSLFDFSTSGDEQQSSKNELRPNTPSAKSIDRLSSELEPSIEIAKVSGEEIASPSSPQQAAEKTKTSDSSTPRAVTNEPEKLNDKVVAKKPTDQKGRGRKLSTRPRAGRGPITHITKTK